HGLRARRLHHPRLPGRARRRCGGGRQDQRHPSRPYHLPLTHHGDPAVRHHEPPCPVLLFVYPHRRTRQHDHVLVQDRVLHYRPPPDPRIVQDHGPIHPRP